MILSECQYNLLTSIASKSKMDCWFYIEQEDGEDYVKDIEEDKDLSLKDGI